MRPLRALKAWRRDADFALGLDPKGDLDNEVTVLSMVSVRELFHLSLTIYLTNEMCLNMLILTFVYILHVLRNYSDD